MPGEKILIVDDDEDIRELLSDRLNAMGYEIAVAEDGIHGLEAIRKEAPDLVFLDIRMPNLDGFGVLERVREEGLETIVVVITAHGGVENTVEAMRLGAYDFVEKPFDSGRIEVVLEKALAQAVLKREREALQEVIREQTPDFIGETSVMVEISATAQRAAASEATVLILGESGTGKEVLAQAIHAWSPRKDGPFVAVNCAALPDQLLESALFGHEKGSFTGAVSQKKGKFELARHYAPPSNMQDHIGFRCAKTPTASGQKPAETRSEPKPARKVQKPTPPKPVDRAPISPDESMEQIASRRPEDVAKLIRSLLAQQAERDDANTEPRLLRKVAILMVGLGTDLSAEVVKYLSDPEIEHIAQTVGELETLTIHEKDEVFDELKGRLVSGDYLLFGGIDFTRGMLEKALGPRKAQALLDRIAGSTSSGYYMLRGLDPNQIIPFISKEHPQTIALILSQVDPTQAAGVINGLPEELQADVSYRIARMDTISPEVLRRLEESLAEDLQALLSGQIAAVGGPKTIAEIINRTGRSTEKSVLQRLDAQDPELAEEVRNQMFTFDDIARMTDREIQVIVKEVDEKDLVIGLKGASEEMLNRFLANLGEEDAKRIREQMEFSGPIRMSNVEDVQLRIVQTVRKLEEEGKVTIVRGDDKDTFV